MLNKFFLKLFMLVNVNAIRISRGHIGSMLGTQNILVLHSIGRKSGKHLLTPIAYFFTNGYYFLVGSNWGKEQNPAWFHNLMAEPQTMIEVWGKRLTVIARQAEGSEYEHLWLYAIVHHPPYQHYKNMTRRQIPIIILQPVT
jgi:deazaflavin-dependent oxidoreductase (nitroreductase family)